MSDPYLSNEETIWAHCKKCDGLGYLRGEGFKQDVCDFCKGEGRRWPGDHKFNEFFSRL